MLRSVPGRLFPGQPAGLHALVVDVDQPDHLGIAGNHGNPSRTLDAVGDKEFPDLGQLGRVGRPDRLSAQAEM